MPKRSRTWNAIEDCFKYYKESSDYRTALEKMFLTYGHYSSVHALNNLCVCLLALLYSGNDYQKGITDAVLAGIDTDCNGATVGSVLGAIAGAEKLPSKWTAPLHDTYHSHVAGEGKVKISDIATRISAFSVLPDAL